MNNRQIPKVLSGLQHGFGEDDDIASDHLQTSGKAPDLRTTKQLSGITIINDGPGNASGRFYFSTVDVCLIQ
jgi:hypothetical protein